MKPTLTFVFALLYSLSFSQAGSLDPTFGTGGKYISTDNLFYQNHAGVSAVAVDSASGKIILAGWTFTQNANGYNGAPDFSVLRLNKNGTLDMSFGTNGRVTIDFTLPKDKGILTSDYGNSVAIQTDGKIVVAGTVNCYENNDSTKTANLSDIGITRLTPDGQLDKTFNGSGKKRIDLSTYTTPSGNYYSSYDECYAVVIKPNGNIVLGGNTYNYYDATAGRDAALVELKLNGGLNSAFGNNGVQIIPINGSDETVAGLALEPGGGIVATGNLMPTVTTSSVLVIKTLGNGSLNTHFNGSGYATTNVPGSTYDAATSVGIQKSGKIVVGGTNYVYQQSNDSIANTLLLRYNVNGSLDRTFGNNGITVFTKAHDVNEGRCISVLKNDKIIQVGSQYTRGQQVYTDAGNTEVIRYNRDGTFDSSFGTYGRSVVALGHYVGYELPSENPFGCAVQADGKIIAAGYTSWFTSNHLQGGVTEYAVRVKESGRNYGVSGPNDTTITIASGNSVVVNNIDPVLYPDTTNTIVKYRLYTSPYNMPIDSGYGSVSGKSFAVGTTTVIYSSTIDSLQRAIFTVTVKSNSNTSSLIANDNKAALQEGNFTVSVSPNPSAAQFTFRLNSSKATAITNLRIFDASGKVMEAFSNVTAGQSLQFGSQYHPGMYFAEITQGTNRKIIKLVKQ